MMLEPDNVVRRKMCISLNVRCFERRGRDKICATGKSGRTPETPCRCDMLMDRVHELANRLNAY
jgi:hypothetical protein